MMPPHSDHQLYNSRIIENYLRLVKKSYPHVDISALLDYAGIQPYQIADSGHWFSQEQVDRFHDKLVELGRNPDIAREAGRFVASADALGPYRSYLLGMLGPSTIFKLISKVASHLTRSASYTSRRLGSRKVEITVRPFPGMQEKKFQCVNRWGWFEAAVHMFEQNRVEIEHPQCLFRGDSVCRYIVSWNKSSAAPLKRFRNWSFLSLPLLLAAAHLYFPGISSASALLGGGLTLSLLALLAEIEDKINIKKQVERIRKETEESLIQASLNHDNALLTDEIGRAISQETDLQGILRRVVELISQRMNFDRVMVFLPNEEKSHLDLHVESGFFENSRRLLQNLSIPIDPDNRSRVLARVFWDQRAVIVESSDKLKSGVFSPEGFRLIEELGAKSFLCCPIVCKGTSLGVLAADKIDRPLTQTDLSLMDGVAAYIGIALRNADLLEGTARQLKEIQEKDAELARQQENLEEQVKMRTIQLQEALRAAETASKAKSEFLANMSHEIRTPLHGVMGLNELLLESGLNPQQATIAQKAQVGAESLLAVINDILDFSKIEANKIDIEVIDFDLQALLGDVFDLLRPHATAKGLHLLLEKSPSTPIWVQGDPLRLRQVLTNLIGNAIKFTEEGGVTLVVSVSSKTIGPRLLFEVQDTGIGISEDQRKSIFESFRQADGSTSRRYGGTGLGTSIAKRLVELMGGAIDFKSSPGEGSTFWFDIPLRTGTISPAPEEKTGHTDTVLAPKTGTILIVEDVPLNRDILISHLEKAGHTVFLATNGLEALEALRKKSVDLVVMDIQMPEMNGLEATCRIRRGEAGGEKANLPIIAMTANATSSCRQDCLEAGVDDLIIKPVRKAQLLDAVSRQLSRQEGLFHLQPSSETGSLADTPVEFEEALSEFGLNRVDFVKVFTIFIRNARETLSRLDCAYKEENISVAEQLAHELKGSAAQFFARPLSRAVEDLEQVGFAEEADSRRALEKVREEFRRLEAKWQELGRET